MACAIPQIKINLAAVIKPDYKIINVSFPPGILKSNLTLKFAGNIFQRVYNNLII